MTNEFHLPLLPSAIAAALFCLLLGTLLGARAIDWLKRHFREPIKSISPTVVRLHQHKDSTPTMGGLFIVAGLTLSVLLFGDVQSPRVMLALLTALGFAAIGTIDDLVKLKTTRRGISAREKLIAQFAVALLVAVSQAGTDEDLGPASVALNVLVLVAAANAVNVTDGLDGLAGGCGLIASLTATGLLLFKDAAELSVVSAALAGALAAFLWFNRHPARVFMGDTGSQPLGALLGYFAVSTHSYATIACVCGVFVIEAASVVIQLASYFFRGKRLFLCAPLHHHFQFAGWPELCIVRRFWLASLAFAIVGIGLETAELRPPTAQKSAATPGNLLARSTVSAIEQPPLPPQTALNRQADVPFKY